MHKALLAKSTQHEWLCRRLLDTANRVLVEHTKNDSYRGDAGDGTGKNHLGNLLMQVRQVLRQCKVISLSPPLQPTPVIHEGIQQSSASCDNESREDEPMDTSSPSMSATEPLLKSPTPLDDIQTSSHEESTGSPTTGGVQNSSAISTQAISGTSAGVVMTNTPSQDTNVKESNKSCTSTLV